MTGSTMSQDTPDLTPADGGATAPPSSATGATAVTPSVAPRSTTTPTTAASIADSRDDDLVVLEASRPSLAARAAGEALSTFLLVLVGLGVTLYSPLSNAGSLGIALAFGLALVAGSIALGHVSGGHFNPAVTLGAVVAGRTPVRDLVPYWLAQLVGATLAAAALFATIPSALPALISPEGTARTFFSGTANGYGSHSPLSTQSQGQVTFDLLPALLIEVVVTAVLVAVVLGATTRRNWHVAAPFAFGLSYAGLLLLAAPITNGGLNPARSTAAAVFSESWALGQLWVFWAAPLVGAAVAGLAHRAFAVDADRDNLLEEDHLQVDDDSLLDDDVAVSPRA
jgi:aquaporin Z